jgi:hypothetical protein
MIYAAGLDLGQLQDPSALVICEAHGKLYQMNTPMGVKQFEGPPFERLDIRHVERFPLGTKYAQICQMVWDRVQAAPRPNYLAIDQTGVGNGVIEIFGGINPVGVTFTSGKAAQQTGPTSWNVPKRDLVARVVVAVQNGVLRIAKTLPHADLLIRELLNFRAKISLAGNDSYEAWRERDHDDLVFAVALAAWMAEWVLRLDYAAGTAAGPQTPFSISPI